LYLKIGWLVQKYAYITMKYIITLPKTALDMKIFLLKIQANPIAMKATGRMPKASPEYVHIKASMTNLTEIKK
jgi:hypothetical protein